MTRKIIVLLVLLFATAGPSYKTAQGSLLEVHFDWRLSLDANGKISSLVPANPDYQPQVRQQVEEMIHRWHFTPGKFNGSPALTETTLRVDVALGATNSGDYIVQVADADTGPTYRHVVKPRYPEYPRNRRREGRVLLRVDYDAQGEIVAIAPMQYIQEPPVDHALTRAALDAVAQWKLEPEAVAGYGVPGSAIVPVCFYLSSSEAACRRKAPKDSHGKSASSDSTRPIALNSVVSLDMGTADHLH